MLCIVNKRIIWPTIIGTYNCRYLFFILVQIQIQNINTVLWRSLKCVLALSLKYRNEKTCCLKEILDTWNPCFNLRNAIVARQVNVWASERKFNLSNRKFCKAPEWRLKHFDKTSTMHKDVTKMAESDPSKRGSSENRKRKDDRLTGNLEVWMWTALEDLYSLYPWDRCNANCESDTLRAPLARRSHSKHLLSPAFFLSGCGCPTYHLSVLDHDLHPESSHMHRL